MARQARFVERPFVSGAGLVVLLLASGCFAADTPDQSPPKSTVPEIHLCTDPRPEMCMEIYMPVCGFTKDGVARTYPNSCHACAHAEVVRYTPGACKAQSPPN